MRASFQLLVWMFFEGTTRSHRAVRPESVGRVPRVLVRSTPNMRQRRYPTAKRKHGLPPVGAPNMIRPRVAKRPEGPTRTRFSLFSEYELTLCPEVHRFISMEVLSYPPLERWDSARTPVLAPGETGEYQPPIDVFVKSNGFRSYMYTSYTTAIRSSPEEGRTKKRPPHRAILVTTQEET